MSCLRTTLKLLTLGLLLSPLRPADAQGPDRDFEVGPAATSQVLEIIDGSGKRVGHYNASRALVIGISDYTNGWPNLPGAADDVQAVVTGLEKHGFEVQSKLNLDHRQLDQVIREFIANQGQEKDTRILIYFAGHGHTLQQSYGGEMGYVVPSDAPPASNHAGFLERALAMERFELYAKQIQAKHALFLFDSCFSGSIFELTSRANLMHISAKTARPVRQFITSGSAAETVPDRSIFRRQFLAALEGEGDLDGDGYMTSTELGEFLKRKVINYSKGTQHPQVGKIRHPGLDKGDFVFPLPMQAEPPETSFAIGDLKGRAAKIEASKAAWVKHLEDMRTAFQEVEALEDRPVDAFLKEEAWRRFMEAFGREGLDDNPYSDDDDVLRKRGGKRQVYWRRKVSRPGAVRLPPKTVTPPAGKAWAEPVLGMRFRFIPAGTFWMGSPEHEKGRRDDEPQHKVALTHGFWMSETEVTQWQWQELMENKPSHFKDCGWGCPVESVSWPEAIEFANELSDRAGLASCYEVKKCRGKYGSYTTYFGEDGKCITWSIGVECSGYRLPTEAEWEYAARAGTTSPFWTGGNIATNQANCDGSRSAGKYRESTVEVRSFEPNPWGLHDVHGNVWEWVWDRWTIPEYESDSPDESGRIARGGSWRSGATGCRSAIRLAVVPYARVNFVGFRLVRTYPSHFIR